MRFVADMHSLRIRHLNNAMTYSLANGTIDVKGGEVKGQRSRKKGFSNSSYFSKVAITQ
jgi:hypothetical protein